MGDLRVGLQDPDDLDELLGLAEASPEVDLVMSAGRASAEDVEGQVEPVSAVLLAGAAVALAKFACDWWESRRGGLVIDQRPGASTQLRRDATLPYGYVVVFPPDAGDASVEVRDVPKDAAERLLEALVSGALGAPGAAVETLKGLGLRPSPASTV